MFIRKLFVYYSVRESEWDTDSRNEFKIVEIFIYDTSMKWDTNISFNNFLKIRNIYFIDQIIIEIIWF